MEKNKYFILDEQQHRENFAESANQLSPFDIGIPLVDCSDKTIQEIYYFRWHTYCRHIKQTPVGYVITEFLPDVPWAGVYNTISCAAGHHFYEGRWLHGKEYLDDYAKFWFSEGANPRLYSFWFANAVCAYCRISGDFAIADKLYDDLKANYFAWENTHLTETGLFYQVADRDGMEYSISGDGCRPTINSYMYGELKALADLAMLFGKDDEAALFTGKAERLKESINTVLWDDESGFYKTVYADEKCDFADVREQIGYIPWYFNIPDRDKSKAWKYLNDEEYFFAPYGPTTAERNHPDFMKKHDHECLWNGPSWPYATSQTLTAMSNLLFGHEQSYVSKSDYYNLLKTYAKSHYLTENGERVKFIDENLDPFTGEWIARKILQNTVPERADKDRGVDYNHSTFCDLVLSGLAGVRPNESDILDVNPLFGAEDMDYFCADGIMYHGRAISVVWDKTGARYDLGAGWHVFVDGKRRATASVPEKMIVQL